MNTVAIIQARTGSTRLPRKVMLDVEGDIMLARVVERIGRAEHIDRVVVATTTQSSDDELASICEQRGWDCFRGSETDLLDRFYQTAMNFSADIVVRVPSDCPLIDPNVVDQVVGSLLERRETVDYAANTIDPRCFPRGLDTEALFFSTLETTWKEDSNRAWREHVTPYIYNNPDKFCLYHVKNEPNYAHLRWTVDVDEDLDLVRHIYRHFGHDRFTWHDVIQLVTSQPELTEINDHVQQKKV